MDIFDCARCGHRHANIYSVGRVGPTGSSCLTCACGDRAPMPPMLRRQVAGVRSRRAPTVVLALGIAAIGATFLLLGQAIYAWQASPPAHRFASLPTSHEVIANGPIVNSSAPIVATKPLITLAEGSNDFAGRVDFAVAGDVERRFDVPWAEMPTIVCVDTAPRTSDEQPTCSVSTTEMTVTARAGAQVAYHVDGVDDAKRRIFRRGLVIDDGLGHELARCIDTSAGKGCTATKPTPPAVSNPCLSVSLSAEMPGASSAHPECWFASPLAAPYSSTTSPL